MRRRSHSPWPHVCSCCSRSSTVFFTISREYADGAKRRRVQGRSKPSLTNERHCCHSRMPWGSRPLAPRRSIRRKQSRTQAKAAHVACSARPSTELGLLSAECRMDAEALYGANLILVEDMERHRRLRRRLRLGRQLLLRVKNSGQDSPNSLEAC